MAYIALVIVLVSAAAFCFFMACYSYKNPPTPRCKECQWVVLPVGQCGDAQSHAECGHTSNANTDIVKDWFAEHTITTYTKRPRDLNADNKCENYRSAISSDFGM